MSRRVRHVVRILADVTQGRHYARLRQEAFTVDRAAGGRRGLQRQTRSNSAECH